MEFIKRPVVSRPGLTQEQALTSLQASPLFSRGTRIASIRPQGDRWLANLLIPKTAADDESDSGPPSDGGGSGGPPVPPDDGGEDDGAPDEDVSEGPPNGPPGEGKDKKPGKGGTDQQVVTLLTEILHALQGGPPGMGGPDDMGPGAGGPPAPPPHGGPMGGPGGPPGAGKMPMGGGAKLRPGEIPNRPGAAPIGAPAFSNVQHQAFGAPMPGGAGGLPGGGMGTPAPTGGTGSCPTCGGAIGPDGSCPTCGMGGAGGAGGAPGAPMTGYASLEGKIASVAGKVATITVSGPAGVSIKEAKAQLDSIAGPYGYRVLQIRRVDGRPRALLSVR